LQEFLRAGFDFFDKTFAGTREKTSALAFFISLVSIHPEQYLPNFKSILTELQDNHLFDPNMEIFYTSESPTGIPHNYQSYESPGDFLSEWERPIFSSRHRGRRGNIRHHGMSARGRSRRRTLAHPSRLPDYPTPGGPSPLDRGEYSPPSLPAFSPTFPGDQLAAQLEERGYLLGRVDEANRNRERMEERQRVHEMAMDAREAADDANGAGPSTRATTAPAPGNTTNATTNETLDIDELMTSGMSPRSIQRLFDRADAAEEEIEEEIEEDEVQEEEAVAVADESEKKPLLNIAASFGGVDAMRILLEIGATPDEIAIHEVVIYLVSYPFAKVAGTACLELLFEAGVDLNVTDAADEQTVLHIIVTGSCDGILEMLLERGADPTKRDSTGRTAADIAGDLDDLDALEILNRFTRLRRLSSQDERVEAGTEEIPEELVCVTCLQRRKEVILAPCGHKIMCARCTKRLLTRPEERDRRCPTCRLAVESFVTTVYE
jgi:hypothetical protein